MKIDLEVTQEHIDSGRVHNPQMCPVALAFGSHSSSAWVTSCSASIYIGGTCYSAWLPDELCTFIRKFDNGETVEPMTTVVDMWIPQEIHSASF